MLRARPVALLSSGFVLVLLGLLWTSLHGQSGFLGKFLWVSGGAALALFLARTAEEIRFLVLHARSFSEPGLTWTLLLAGGLLLVASVAARGPELRWDLTRQRVYSLSPGSLEAIRQLDRDVEMIAFLREGSADWREAGELLDIYASSSRRIRAARIDPERDPAAAREHGVEEIGVIVLHGGGREERVTDLSEAGLTAGLLRLLTGHGRPVLFSRGHDEHELRSSGRDGLSKLLSYLGEDGYSAGTIDLVRPDSFPEPPGVVVLAGPRHALLPVEIRNLLDFLDRGGRVALFVDPGVETGLRQSLLRHGIRLGDDSLRSDAWRALGLEPGQLLAEPTREHAASAGLRARALLDVARGVEPASPEWTVSESNTLLRAVVVPEQSARGPGPGVAAAAAWQIRAEDEGLETIPQRPWARLIVVGDADLLTNRYLERQGNRQVVLSFIHWLAQEDLLLRAEHARAPRPVLLDRATMRILWVVSMLVVPLGSLLTGIAVWLRRRASGME